MKAKNCLILICLLAVISTFSCKKQNSGPTAASIFQGPLNPGFEDVGTVTDSAKLWWSDACAQRKSSSNTGFMPTNGNYFMSFFNNSEIYQDNVDLSQSSKLLFDYQIITSWSSSDTLSTIISFITNGKTITLWSTKVPGAPYGTLIQKKGQTITLPSLPNKGRLMINFWSVNSGSFDIDNIRTQ